MYLDSAYIAKYYVNEPDADAVRNLIRAADSLHSSAWALVEMTSVFHRHIREGSLSLRQGQQLMDLFRSHVDDAVWQFSPIHTSLLETTATLIRGLPKKVPLRAGDAIHIATALELGEQAIWTNDRHLLAAAAHFGLAGRSV